MAITWRKSKEQINFRGFQRFSRGFSEALSETLSEETGPSLVLKTGPSFFLFHCFLPIFIVFWGYF